MYKHTKSGKRKIIAGILLAIFVLGLFLFVHAGRWLVKQDELARADCIFILMGGVSERLAAAEELLLAGYASQLMMANDKVQGSDVPELKPYLLPSNAELTRQLAVKTGVSDSLITILPGRASSTRDEAVILANYIKRHPDMDTIIIVSSASHTRRSSIIFNNVMNDQGLQVKVITFPSPYSQFVARKWWKHRDSAKTVVLEYLKLLYFCAYERFK